MQWDRAERRPGQFAAKPFVHCWGLVSTSTVGGDVVDGGSGGGLWWWLVVVVVGLLSCVDDDDIMVMLLMCAAAFVEVISRDHLALHAELQGNLGSPGRGRGGLLARMSICRSHMALCLGYT